MPSLQRDSDPEPQRYEGRCCPVLPGKQRQDELPIREQSMTPGSLFAELVRLQDAYAAADQAARTKRETSPAGIAKKVACDAYLDFKRLIARDFFVMLACASEDRDGRGLDAIADRVARTLADRLDFDAVAAQVHHASVKAMESRHEMEQVRREVDELRRMVETTLRERELKLVG